jgi:WD40 repeat protein
MESAGRVDDLAFAPDGKTLYTLTDGGHGPADIWDLQTGRHAGALGNYRAEIAALRHTADRTLAVTDEATTAQGQVSRLWDLTSATLLKSESDFGEGVTGPIALSPDGRLIAIGREQGTLIWDLDRDASVSTTGAGRLPADDPRTEVFSPDGAVAITRASGSDDRLNLWDVRTGSLVRELDGATPVAFSPAGDVLATTRGCQSVGLARVSGGAEEWRELHRFPTCPAGLLFAPDGGTLLVLTPEGGPLFGNAPSQASLWDVKSGRTVAELQGYTSDRRVAAAFTADGRTVATSGTDGSVHLWDPLTGRLLLTLAGPDQAIVALQFTRDGTALTAGYSTAVHTWRIAARQVNAAARDR